MEFNEKTGQTMMLITGHGQTSMLTIELFSDN